VRTTLKELRRYRVLALDGHLGLVDDVYFDDRTWDLRALAVDTGLFSPRRRVLLPLWSVDLVDRDSEALRVTRSTEQVRNSPHAGEVKLMGPEKRHRAGALRTESPPVRAVRRLLAVRTPARLPSEAREPPPPAQPEVRDPHLRSTKGVVGYRLQAVDGEAGVVEDFVLETTTRKLWFLIAGTAAESTGDRVVLRPHHIGRISSADKKVYVNVPEKDVKNSPKLDPGRLS
jgi:hypothetical protein